ncbi:MAG: hypothetical protein JWM80_3995 [Cyanobacteria bacterium RYN_339]|nr:hypothetical protein [Cyanobacteria bacterium RYN_339]
METLIYSLVTASATVAGGLWVARQPQASLNAERQALLMAAGGGLLFATLLCELLPEMLVHGWALGFPAMVAGMLAVMGFERFVAGPVGAFLDRHVGLDDGGHGPCDHHHHGPRPTVMSHGAACSVLGCLLVCTFFDGIALTASLGAGLHIGMMVAIGLLFHLLPEGIVAASVVRGAGRSATAAGVAAIAVGLALLAGVGAASLIGTTLGTLAVGVPFAAGVILHTLSHQLAPMALRVRHGELAFGGAATLFMLLEFLLPHVHAHQ